MREHDILILLSPAIFLRMLHQEKEEERSAIDREISLVYKRRNTFDVPLNGSDIVFLHAHACVSTHAGGR